VTLGINFQSPKELIKGNLYLPPRAFFKGYIMEECPIFWLASLSLNGVFAASPKKGGKYQKYIKQ
jgi:hypothetical protein